MANYPADLRYTKDHEWARREGDLVRIGITSFAVDQLGDVTLVDLPAKGTKLTAAAHFGDIESVKAVSELFAPLGGEVVEVNAALADHPELINESPYDKGWMLVVRPASSAELDKLFDAAAYTAFLGTL
ncbi:MAG TPA: glycine cleavage system protein GcvH [Polyangiales bacterium]|jgi:glycine cleavage system H protein|nr:glycine cleavage system protein GcvH [Polyangiales bacterium]